MSNSRTFPGFPDPWEPCGTYMGALFYADDITLSCPSVHGLNKMMSICSDFATNNFITFNAKKKNENLTAHQRIF